MQVIGRNQNFTNPDHQPSFIANQSHSLQRQFSNKFWSTHHPDCLFQTHIPSGPSLRPQSSNEHFANDQYVRPQQAYHEISGQIQPQPQVWRPQNHTLHYPGHPAQVYRTTSIAETGNCTLGQSEQLEQRRYLQAAQALQGLAPPSPYVQHQQHPTQRHSQVLSQDLQLIPRSASSLSPVPTLQRRPSILSGSQTPRRHKSRLQDSILSEAEDLRASQVLSVPGSDQGSPDMLTTRTTRRPARTTTNTTPPLLPDQSRKKLLIKLTGIDYNQLAIDAEDLVSTTVASPAKRSVCARESPSKKQKLHNEYETDELEFYTETEESEESGSDFEEEESARKHARAPSLRSSPSRTPYTDYIRSEVGKKTHDQSLQHEPPQLSTVNPYPQCQNHYPHSQNNGLPHNQQYHIPHLYRALPIQEPPPHILPPLTGVQNPIASVYLLPSSLVHLTATVDSLILTSTALQLQIHKHMHIYSRLSNLSLDQTTLSRKHYSSAELWKVFEDINSRLDSQSSKRLGLTKQIAYGNPDFVFTMFSALGMGLESQHIECKGGVWEAREREREYLQRCCGVAAALRVREIVAGLEIRWRKKVAELVEKRQAQGSAC